jgi:antitoxin component YwqK of YwqJK toxin-antitoxin module
MFENDLFEGIWKVYHQNGNFKQIGAYKAGKAQGKWKFYHDNGKLSETGTFLDDQRTGKWKSYSEKGKFISSTNYKNGVIIN